MIVFFNSFFQNEKSVTSTQQGISEKPQKTTTAKVSLVSRLLRTLWWTSFLSGARSQLTEPYPAQFEVARLDGTNGFTLYGDLSGDYSGISVSSAGDVNGDGLSDLLVGAQNYAFTSKKDAGTTHVVFGYRRSVRSGIIDLSNLVGINGYNIIGESIGDLSGLSVSSAGDLNGDGLADVLIGAQGASPLGRTLAGKSYVLFGSRNVISNGSIDLSRINGTEGFTINGEVAGDLSGISVSSAGDVNGDGFVDILIGACLADSKGRSNTGKSYVVFANQSTITGGNLELSSLNGRTGFALHGETVDSQSGLSVSSAGDMNGDGLADIVIGAPYASPSGRLRAGQSFVVFGRRSVISGGVFELSSLNGQNGFILNGESAYDISGFSVSSAGDVNGDGLGDIVIGAWNASLSSRLNTGKSYVVYGSRGMVSGGILELSSLNGMNGFSLNGEATGDKSGISVSSAGDMNGDGLGDIVIGASNASPMGKLNAGKSHVVFGSRSIFSGGSIELYSLNGDNGFILNGDAAGDLSGFSVSCAGDLNGDGLTDLVIGAYNAKPPMKTFAGKTYVVFGRNLTKKTTQVTQNTMSTNTKPPVTLATNPLITMGSSLQTKPQTSTSISQSDSLTLKASSISDPLTTGALLSSSSMNSIVLSSTPKSTTTEQIHSVLAISTPQLFDRTVIIAMSVGAGILGLGCSLFGGIYFFIKNKSLQNENQQNENAAEPYYAEAPPIDDNEASNSIQSPSDTPLKAVNDDVYNVGPLVLD